MIVPRKRLTESALLLLHSTPRLFIKPSRLRRVGRTRILYSTLGTRDPVVVRREAIFFRMVSLTEAYLDALQMDILTGKVSPTTDTLRRMIEEIERTATSNWAARHRAFKRLHGIALTQLDGWQELDAALHVRNSVAHALGSLTASQRANAQLPLQLVRIQAVVADGRINLSDNSLKLLENSCRRFVLAVDALA
jgi:hypothetical protein